MYGQLRGLTFSSSIGLLAIDMSSANNKAHQTSKHILDCEGLAEKYNDANYALLEFYSPNFNPATLYKKSRIRETLNLSTNADNRTNNLFFFFFK